MIVLECMDGKELLESYLSLRDNINKYPSVEQVPHHEWIDFKKLNKEIIRRLNLVKDNM